MRSRIMPSLVYGALLAAGALALVWLDSRRFLWRNGNVVVTFVVAAAFLALGLLIGARVIAASRKTAFDGNPAALRTLRISPRELAVLHELAAGRSNGEIAAKLHISPNTVKTHVARLLEKLDAWRRTDAIARARELGLIR